MSIESTTDSALPKFRMAGRQHHCPMQLAGTEPDCHLPLFALLLQVQV